ncbi:bifunctional phosphoribosylaminoimidazolecarboxamide formyltransferase/IMP cyclohydrolase, partial [Pseudoalteromonas sp. SIMBA_153]
TMVRSAAKNRAHVGIVTDPADYDRVLNALDGGTELTTALRYDLAVKAFEHTAQYDGMIANFLGSRVNETQEPENFPRTFNVQLEKAQDLRYGENPHQNAAFY